MSLNSFALDAFFLCAQEKNFTRAAERLHITQSALSQRIKNLEVQLNTTLFIRERAGVKLTEKGETLLRYCAVRKELEQELESDLSEDPQDLAGTLRVGAFSSVTLSLILPTFSSLAKQHPRIQFHLLSKELGELPNLLRNSTIDFGILNERLEIEGIQSVMLGHEVLVRVRKKKSEFSGWFLDHDESDMTSLNYLKLKKGASVKRHYVDDINGVIEGVRLGLGDAVLPEHLIRDLSDLEIVKGSSYMKSKVYLTSYERLIPSKLSTEFERLLIQEAQRILE